jgi:hypothetical protein
VHTTHPTAFDGYLQATPAMYATDEFHRGG